MRILVDGSYFDETTPAVVFFSDAEIELIAQMRETGHHRFWQYPSELSKECVEDMLNMNLHEFKMHDESYHSFHGIEGE